VNRAKPTRSRTPQVVVTGIDASPPLSKAETDLVALYLGDVLFELLGTDWQTGNGTSYEARCTLSEGIDSQTG